MLMAAPRGSWPAPGTCRDGTPASSLCSHLPVRCPKHRKCSTQQGTEACLGVRMLLGTSLGPSQLGLGATNDSAPPQSQRLPQGELLLWGACFEPQIGLLAVTSAPTACRPPLPWNLPLCCSCERPGIKSRTVSPSLGWTADTHLGTCPWVSYLLRLSLSPLIPQMGVAVVPSSPT